MRTKANSHQALSQNSASASLSFEAALSRQCSARSLSFPPWEEGGAQVRFSSLVRRNQKGMAGGDGRRGRQKQIIVKSVSRRGGRNKGGRKQMQANANKRRQTSTYASKRRGENASKRKQTRANVDKRKQTQTNAYTPLYCGILHPLQKKTTTTFCDMFRHCMTISIALSH